MNSNRVYLAIIAVCIIILGVIFYHFLGGFDEVQVFEKEGKKRSVVGIEYVFPNRRKDPQFEKLDLAKKEIDAGKLQGDLTAIIYKDSTLIDSTRFFIGASFDGFASVVKMPKGYSLREFETEKIYQVFITRNSWVRPLPSEISDRMSKRATENGESLLPLDFEIYYLDGSLRQERWVK